MYTDELQRIIKEHNGVLQGQILLEVIDPNKNPQLKSISYHDDNHSYHMTDDNGTNIDFLSAPFPKEESPKVLVYRKDK